MTYPAVIFLVLLLWSFRWPREKLLYLVFGSVAFSALAIIPPPIAGGLNLLPTFTAGLVLIARSVLDSRTFGAMAIAAFRPSRMGLLTAFVLLGVISAYFYPKLFAGDVMVLPFRIGHVEPLYPTNSNMTQAAYLAVSYALALVFQAQASNPDFLKAFFRSLLVGGVFLVLTGLADMALGSSEHPLLAPYKTADYTFMEDNVVLGFRRVTGVMTEASAYGPACVVNATLLLFLAPLFPGRRERYFAQFMGFALVLMGMVSTSSTAFVGLGVLGIVYVLNLGRRLVGGVTPGADVFRWELVLAFVAVIVASLVALLAPEILVTPQTFIEELVFNKTRSSSYNDRMNWNNISMAALAQTNGVGVGIGGTRTSNWVLSILTNTGILGGCLLFGFIGYQLLRKAPRDDIFTSNVMAAGKMTIIVNMAMTTLSATTPDFGPVMAAIFGLLSAERMFASGRAGQAAERDRPAEIAPPRLRPRSYGA